jgi:hypothetical protein
MVGISSADRLLQAPSDLERRGGDHVAADQVCQANTTEPESEIDRCELGAALTDVRRKIWIWMAAAFCASLGAALAAVAVSRHRDFTLALAMSARVAFLFFWPAYVGGALTSLFGSVFLPLRQHARDLGLAFAAAILVHLGFVVRLCVVGPTPSTRTFVIFGTAAVFALLLALLSISGIRELLPRRFWPPIRFVAMNYIALGFLLDFAKLPLTDLRESLAYLPFLALAILGPAFRLAAWVRNNLARAPRKLGRLSSP